MYVRFAGFEKETLAMESILIEAIPSKLGSIHRDANMIRSAVMINAKSTNGRGGRTYSDTALKKIAAMSEGLPGFLNHVRPEDAFTPRPVQDIAARWTNVRFDAANHR